MTLARAEPSDAMIAIGVGLVVYLTIKVAMRAKAPKDKQGNDTAADTMAMLIGMATPLLGLACFGTVAFFVVRTVYRWITK